MKTIEELQAERDRMTDAVNRLNEWRQKSLEEVEVLQAEIKVQLEAYAYGEIGARDVTSMADQLAALQRVGLLPFDVVLAKLNSPAAAIAEGFMRHQNLERATAERQRYVDFRDGLIERGKVTVGEAEELRILAIGMPNSWEEVLLLTNELTAWSWNCSGNSGKPFKFSRELLTV